MDYARYYVDDIVIFFKIFGQHIEYLDTIFELFDELGIIFINEVYLNLRHLFWTGSARQRPVQPLSK